jgi:peptide/nickel transport system permease protein
MGSTAVVAAFLTVGLLGPAFVTEPAEIDFARAYLPPVWATVGTEHLIGPCLGEVTDGRCHGTWRYPFGTSWAGQDLFSFVVLGTRTALEVALVTALVVVPVGVGVGLVSGVVGGRVDGLVPARWLTAVPTVVLVLTVLSLAAFWRSMSDIFAPVRRD